jgi:cytochrome P450
VSDASTLPRFPFDTPDHLDAEPAHAALCAAGPVARVQLGDGTPVWVAVRYEAVRRVLTDPRFSRAATVAPGAPTITPAVDRPDTMIAMDPPEHTRLRRLSAGAFTSRAVERRRPRIQGIADGLLDAMTAQGPPADLVARFAFPLPIAVLCDLLGIPYEDVDRVRQWSEIAQSIDAHPREAIASAAAELGAYVEGVIAAKRRRPGDDVLTALIEARDHGDRLSEAELLQQTIGILIAGHDTTANQLAISLLTLFRHPDQLALLRDRPELVPGAVEELLRFSRLLTSAFGRVTTEEVELEGVTVPAGATIFALLAAGNRDERVHADPHRLDVTRTGGQHLAFGAGPHVCIGAPLARVELQVALASLLRRLPRLALAVPESELEWKHGSFIRGVRALPVTW